MEKLYLVRLVFQIQFGQSGKYTFEEQLRLYRNNSPEEAYERAIAQGKKEEVTFTQIDHGFVSWVFLGLADLLIPEQSDDNSLLESKSIEPGMEPDYEPYIRQKIRLVRNQFQGHRKAIEQE